MLISAAQVDITGVEAAGMRRSLVAQQRGGGEDWPGPHDSIPNRPVGELHTRGSRRPHYIGCQDQHRQDIEHRSRMRECEFWERMDEQSKDVWRKLKGRAAEGESCILQAILADCLQLLGSEANLRPNQVAVRVATLRDHSHISLAILVS